MTSWINYLKEIPLNYLNEIDCIEVNLEIKAISQMQVYS